jgi:hypothetical protein
LEQLKWNLFGERLKCPLVKAPAFPVSGRVTVITPFGEATSLDDLIVSPLSPPKITMFFPAMGTPGTLIQVHGEDLHYITQVQINNVDVPFSSGPTLIGTF